MKKNKIMQTRILFCFVTSAIILFYIFHFIGAANASLYAGPGSPYYLEWLLMPLIYGNPYTPQDYVQPYPGYGYQQSYNPYGYYQTPTLANDMTVWTGNTDYNPYSYQQSYNPYGYGYQQPYNPYSYQQSYNPYGYGYQQSYNPYSYQQSYNPYGYLGFTYQNAFFPTPDYFVSKYGGYYVPPPLPSYPGGPNSFSYPGGGPNSF